MRAARRQGHRDPGRYGQRRHRGRRRDHAGVPPRPPPPPWPGRADRLGEARRAEHARAVRHAHPVRPARRGVVGACRQDLAAQVGRQRNLRRLAAVIRGRRIAPGSPLGSSCRTQPAQALVPCHRVQPGTEPVRITQPVQLDRRDQEGVEHRPGGFRFGQHRVAAGVEGRGVLVVHRGKAIRVTCDDGRHHGMVLHAPYRSSVWPEPRSERHNQIPERHNCRGPAGGAGPAAGGPRQRRDGGRALVGGAAGNVNVGVAVPVAVEVAVEVSVGMGWVVNGGVGRSGGEGAAECDDVYPARRDGRGCRRGRRAAGRRRTVVTGDSSRGYPAGHSLYPRSPGRSSQPDEDPGRPRPTAGNAIR